MTLPLTSVAADSTWNARGLRASDAEALGTLMLES
jgi:hypothetical protein